MARPKGRMRLYRYDVRGSLHEKTRELIKEDKRTLLMIAQLTGIPFYWLKKFSAGEIKAPNVNRVQYLYEQITLTELIP